MQNIDFELLLNDVPEDMREYFDIFREQADINYKGPGGHNLLMEYFENAEPVTPGVVLMIL